MHLRRPLTVTSCRVILCGDRSFVIHRPRRVAARFGYFVLNDWMKPQNQKSHEQKARKEKKRTQDARDSLNPQSQGRAAVPAKLMEVDLPHHFQVDQLLFMVNGPTPNRLARSHRQEPKRRSHGSSPRQELGGSTRAVTSVR